MQNKYTNELILYSPHPALSRFVAVRGRVRRNIPQRPAHKLSSMLRLMDSNHKLRVRALCLFGDTRYLSADRQVGSGRFEPIGRGCTVPCRRFIRSRSHWYMILSSKWTPHSFFPLTNDIPRNPSALNQAPPVLSTSFSSPAARNLYCQGQPNSKISTFISKSFFLGALICT